MAPFLGANRVGAAAGHVWQAGEEDAIVLVVVIGFKDSEVVFTDSRVPSEL